VSSSPFPQQKKGKKIKKMIAGNFVDDFVVDLLFTCRRKTSSENGRHNRMGVRPRVRRRWWGRRGRRGQAQAPHSPRVLQQLKASLLPPFCPSVLKPYLEKQP